MTRRHDKNFETYITDYAQQNGLAMRGAGWVAALAAAKRLDHTKERSAQTELIPPTTNLLGRLARRLFPRRKAERLSEMEAIRAFFEQVHFFVKQFSYQFIIIIKKHPPHSPHSPQNL